MIITNDETGLEVEGERYIIKENIFNKKIDLLIANKLRDDDIKEIKEILKNKYKLNYIIEITKNGLCYIKDKLLDRRQTMKFNSLVFNHYIIEIN